MILKLNGADFSADNLGKVQVTTQLNAYTKAAIIASGNNSMTNVQKSALDALFLAMGVDGSNNVMSKIRKLYLPIICGDVSKALINYATDSFTKDANLNPANWEIRNHGLVGLNQTQPINLTLNNILTTNNYFSLLLKTEKVEIGVDDTTYGLILRGKTNTNKFLGLRYSSLSSNSTLTLGSYGTEWGGSIIKSSDKIKASAVNFGSGNLDTCMVGTWISTTQPTSYTDLSGETSETLYVFGFDSVNTAKPYAVGMIGEALTLSQAKDIAQKVDELYDAFVSNN